ncbi:hypothetical protein BDR26DRAFT_892064 [Obelidium mucronatum]|nr:hypothetical protein BDR26DRAFT_892064 [Obelidium mucronatum]
MLTSLPPEIIQHCSLSYLETIDLLHLAATCKELYLAILIPRAATFNHIPTAYEALLAKALREKKSQKLKQVELDEKEDDQSAVSTSTKPRLSSSTLDPLTITDHDGLGLRIRYDPVSFANANGWSLYDEEPTLEEEWEIPGVYVPLWATPNTTNTANTAKAAATPAYVPGITRPVKLSPRLKVSRSCTSRLPLHLTSQKCFFNSNNANRLNYFEVTFKEDGSKKGDGGSLSSSSSSPQEQNSPFDFELLPSSLDVMVGLVGKSFLSEHANVPSNDPSSITFESIYGMANVGARKGEGFQFAKPYTFGDTVGVGFISRESVADGSELSQTAVSCFHADTDLLLYPSKRPPTNTVFFTLNGHWVGDAPVRISSDLVDYDAALFPTIGFSTADTAVVATVNFGQSPFLFQMKEFLEPFGFFEGGGGDSSVEQKTDDGGGDSVIQNQLNHVEARYLPVSLKQMETVKNLGWAAYSFLPNATGLDTAADIQMSRNSIYGRRTSKSPIVSITKRLLENVAVVDGRQQSVSAGTNERILFNGSTYVHVRNVQCAMPLVAPNGAEYSSSGWKGYFEVKILRNRSGSVNDDNAPEFHGMDVGFLAIGLALRPYSPFYHVGWDFGSFAYHSDDGKLFDGAGQGGFEWGEAYTVGDVIGCGLTPAGDIYFTKNGVRVGPKRELKTADGTLTAVVGVIPAGYYGWRLHPTISACHLWEVEVNFGENEFQYKH